MTRDIPKIRAMDGSSLVEGVLALRGEGPLAGALPSAGPGDLIGVAPLNDTLCRSSIRLYSQWHRAADGLYAAATPTISIDFGDAMPSLQSLASRMYGEASRKVTVRGEGRPLLTMHFRPVGIEDALRAFAQLDEVEVELAQRGTGLAIRLEGPVRPFAFEKGGPVLEGVRLHCEVSLPPSYCGLNGIGNPRCSWEGQAEWQAGDHGLDTMPIGPCAYGLGMVDWGQDWAGRQCKGPFVQVGLHEDELTLRPAHRVWLTAEGDGFAELEPDGPRLRLGIGRALLASLLARGDHAEASFRTGIGHVDGQTGRSVGECGGTMRQDIRWLELRLDRHRHELRIEGEGELEPLAPALAAAVGSLGPQLRFSVALSRTWLLARGIALPRFWDAWKQELGTTGVW